VTRGRVPEDERTLKLGAAFESYQAEAREIDHRAMYDCDHSFVIPRGDGYLCKDCDTMFDDHPADAISSVAAPVIEPEPIEEEPEYVYASGVVTGQATYTFPNVAQPFPTQTIMASGVSSFANFAKPLARAVFPKEIADEIYKVTQ